MLPGTLKLLRTLAKGLAADDHVIRSRQSDAVGFDTVHRSATDVLTRAGLSLTIHGLRKTFASLVAEASGDEILAMRLLRDRLPGQTGRYIKRNLPDLLDRYSPLHRVRGSEGRVPGSTGGSARESNPPEGHGLAAALRAIASDIVQLADALDQPIRPVPPASSGHQS